MRFAAWRGLAEDREGQQRMRGFQHATAAPLPVALAHQARLDAAAPVAAGSL